MSVSMTYRLPASGGAYLLTCEAPGCDEWNGLEWVPDDPSDLDGPGKDFCRDCRREAAQLRRDNRHPIP